MSCCVPSTKLKTCKLVHFKEQEEVFMKRFFLLGKLDFSRNLFITSKLKPAPNDADQDLFLFSHLRDNLNVLLSLRNVNDASAVK